MNQAMTTEALLPEVRQSGSVIRSLSSGVCVRSGKDGGRLGSAMQRWDGNAREMQKWSGGRVVVDFRASRVDCVDNCCARVLEEDELSKGGEKGARRRGRERENPRRLYSMALNPGSRKREHVRMVFSSLGGDCFLPEG